MPKILVVPFFPDTVYIRIKQLTNRNTTKHQKKVRGYQRKYSLDFVTNRFLWNCLQL